MMSDSEQFYDTEIAPKLLELQKTCESRGMSFVAFVEFERDGTGSTAKVMPGASAEAYTALWGARCRGNVDLFMIWARRHAQEHGHSSAVITLLEKARMTKQNFSVDLRRVVEEQQRYEPEGLSVEDVRVMLGAADEIARLREQLSRLRIAAWERHTSATEDNRTLLTRLCEDALELPQEQRMTVRPTDDPDKPT